MADMEVVVAMFALANAAAMADEAAIVGTTSVDTMAAVLIQLLLLIRQL